MSNETKRATDYAGEALADWISFSADVALHTYENLGRLWRAPFLAMGEPSDRTIGVQTATVRFPSADGSALQLTCGPVIDAFTREAVAGASVVLTPGSTADGATDVAIELRLPSTCTGGIFELILTDKKDPTTSATYSLGFGVPGGTP